MDSPISFSSEQEFTEHYVVHLINLGDQNQYDGNYQEATKKYLQALEVIYQILDDNTQALGDKSSLTSLMATILANL